MRGLADKVKRTAIFNRYREKSDILCLQETHSDKSIENLWRNEWGGRILFSHGKSNARGVCILFNKNFYCNINNISYDFDGRVVCCEISWPDYQDPITICNVYGPNRDTPAFYDALNQRLCDCSGQK